MSAKDFVAKNPDYFLRAPLLKDDWERVKDQAIEHTRYLQKSTLLSKNRPNETQGIPEYRNDNRRQLTKASIDKFKTKTSRIFRSSGLNVSAQSLSSSLTEYLQSKPYQYMGRPADFETHIFENIYPRAIEDPNAVEILLPQNPINPEIPPILPFSDGGIEKNKPVTIKKIIVPCEDIKAFESDFFSWIGGYKNISGQGETESIHPWFWVVDDSWFYRYLPVRMDSRKVVYELQAWYWHDTGIEGEKVMPVNILPGNAVCDEDNNITYQVSLIAGFLEYADEFVNRFSDGQAVWVTSAFPIHVMKEMACTAPGCYDGKIPNPDPNAKESFIKCHECGGLGKVTRPSPYGVIIEKREDNPDAAKGGDSYRLINPDTEILKTTYEIPFDILQKGERQIGLDVLENKIESGVSREMRFEDVKDKLADIAEKLETFMEFHLFFTECLLNAERPQRKMPDVNTPIDFQMKTSEDLKKEAQEALPTDRLQKTTAYLSRIYKHNKPLLKVYEVAFRYAPLLLTDWEEVKDLKNMGVIDENDIVKIKNAIPVFTELSKRAGWVDMTDETAFTAADEILTNRKLFRPERLVLMNDNGEA